MTRNVSMRNLLTSAAMLDDQIREVDLLIAEIVAQSVEVEANLKEQGAKERGPELLRALSPFKQHLAELTAQVGAWRHERIRHEYRWAAWSGGIETEPPGLELEVADLGEIGAKYEAAEARDDSLLAKLQASLDAEGEKRAAAANERNEARAEAAAVARQRPKQSKAEMLAAREQREADRQKVLARFKRADDCIGPGCEHCAEHARPELPAAGTEARAAIDARNEAAMKPLTTKYED